MRAPECLTSFEEWHNEHLDVATWTHVDWQDNAQVTRTIDWGLLTATSDVGCCDACIVIGGNVDVFYWPVEGVNTDCESVIGTSYRPIDEGFFTYDERGHKYFLSKADPYATTDAPTPVMTPAPVMKLRYRSVGPLGNNSIIDNASSSNGSVPANKTIEGSIAVYSGYTFTSPTVYVGFSQLGARDRCGTIGSNIDYTMLSFLPGELSTLQAPDWQRNGIAASLTRSFNFADLPCPPQDVLIADQYKPGPGNPYRPVLAAPSKLKGLQPGWSNCNIEAAFQGIDPPRALTPDSVIVAEPTPASPNPQNVEKPQPAQAPPLLQPNATPPPSSSQGPGKPPSHLPSNPKELGKPSNDAKPPKQDPPKGTPPKQDPPLEYPASQQKFPDAKSSAPALVPPSQGSVQKPNNNDNGPSDNPKDHSDDPPLAQQPPHIDDKPKQHVDDPPPAQQPPHTDNKPKEQGSDPPPAQQPPHVDNKPKEQGNDPPPVQQSPHADNTPKYDPSNLSNEQMSAINNALKPAPSPAQNDDGGGSPSSTGPGQSEESHPGGQEKPASPANPANLPNPSNPSNPPAQDPQSPPPAVGGGGGDQQGTPGSDDKVPVAAVVSVPDPDGKPKAHTVAFNSDGKAVVTAADSNGRPEVTTIDAPKKGQEQPNSKIGAAIIYGFKAGQPSPTPALQPADIPPNLSPSIEASGKIVYYSRLPSLGHNQAPANTEQAPANLSPSLGPSSAIVYYSKKADGGVAPVSTKQVPAGSSVSIGTSGDIVYYPRLTEQASMPVLIDQAPPHLSPSLGPSNAIVYYSSKPGGGLAPASTKQIPSGLSASIGSSGEVMYYSPPPAATASFTPVATDQAPPNVSPSLAPSSNAVVYFSTGPGGAVTPASTKQVPSGLSASITSSGGAGAVVYYSTAADGQVTTVSIDQAPSGLSVSVQTIPAGIVYYSSAAGGSLTPISTKVVGTGGFGAGNASSTRVLAFSPDNAGASLITRGELVERWLVSLASSVLVVLALYLV